MTARNEGRPRTGEGDEWMMRASCRGMGDDLFPEASEQQSARGICRKCPVRRECLAVALDDRIEWGVWGGMTERERRALLRERPGVKSWWDVFGLNAIGAAAPGGGPAPSAPLGRAARRASFSMMTGGIGVVGAGVPGPARPGARSGRHPRPGGAAEPGAAGRAARRRRA